MAKFYVLSQKATNDIDEIFEFGKHKFGNTQAIAYLIGLSELFDKLSNTPTPDIGRNRNEIKKGLSSFSYQCHIVFCRKLENHIRIVRVLYGGRDLLKIFD